MLLVSATAAASATAVAAAIVAAGEEKDEDNDDPDDVVVIENIAKAVIHSNLRFSVGDADLRCIGPRVGLLLSTYIL